MASSQPQKDDKSAGPAASGNEAGDASTTKKSPTALEEDDEFEDFPVEGAFLNDCYFKLSIDPHPPQRTSLRGRMNVLLTI